MHSWKPVLLVLPVVLLGSLAGADDSPTASDFATPCLQIASESHNSTSEAAGVACLTSESPDLFDPIAHETDERIHDGRQLTVAGCVGPLQSGSYPAMFACVLASPQGCGESSTCYLVGRVLLIIKP